MPKTCMPMGEQPQALAAVSPFHNSSRLFLSSSLVPFPLLCQLDITNLTTGPTITGSPPFLVQSNPAPFGLAAPLYPMLHWRLLSQSRELPVRRASFNFLATIALTSPILMASASMSTRFRQVQTSPKFMSFTAMAPGILISPPELIPCHLASASPQPPVNSTLQGLCPS